jgi:hypothetical protein
MDQIGKERNGGYVRDRCLLLVDFVGPAVGDVTAPGRLVFFGSSMMPVRRMKGGTTWLHQLRRDKSVGRIDQKPLRARTEWLDIVGVLTLICLGHQTPHSYESVRVTRFF